ncbi:hypothetical protein LTR05_005548 [Lithohypha guttulata]|uniref:Galactose oxidase/kelch, beta-propeller n=1 Tax=Lithohypha guttulata TaxID=1690604 RepID=A0AAN7SYD0_9EURO|nr:hypothetical protein LTR05_005548 [Lithohypha guttulata]
MPSTLTLTRLVSALSVIWVIIPVTLAGIANWDGLRGVQIREIIALEGGLLTDGIFSNGDWADTKIRNADKGLYLKINLTNSFNIHNQTADEILIRGEQENSDPSAPNYISGGMFHNDYQWYTFGGQADKDPIGVSVNQGMLFPSNPAQTIFSPSVRPENNHRPIGPVSEYIVAGSYASSLSNDRAQAYGWYLGGVGSTDNTSLLLYGDPPTQPAKTFIRVDMTDPEHASFQYMRWPDGQSNRAQGGLVWLPYGEAGVLVSLGGAELPKDLYEGSPTNMPLSNSFMTQLLIYDIARDTWYEQSTLEASSGPPQLAKFCTAVVPTKDGRSHEIFVYGGYDGTSGKTGTSDDVWVLSVPAFQWTLMRPTGRGETHGRYGSLCFSPNPTTMITVGGSIYQKSALLEDSIIDVLDLTSFVWTGEYNASANDSFTAPATIVEQLRWPSSDGPGNVPVDNLNGSGLNDLFSTRYVNVLPLYYPYNTTTVREDKDSEKWKIPVIATLCSVIPVLLIFALALCCVRRRRRNKEGVERTRQNRRNIFSWLGKPSHIDPKTEKSDGSGETAVEHRSDYFTQPGYKGARDEIYEAPSNVTSPGWGYGHTSPGLTSVTAISSDGRHEMMDNSRRNHTSIRDHPYYPRSIAGAHISDVQSEGSSHPAELASSPGYTSVSEMRHDRSNENLPSPPADLDLSQQGRDMHVTPTGMAPGSVIPRKPVSERRISSPDPSSMTPRPGHRRNPSSISSDIPGLPSPEPKEDARRSRQIEALPDLPGASAERTSPADNGRVSVYREVLEDTGRR